MVHLKNPKKRTSSSRQWLLRQLSDPYVQEAKAQGYRSRAAFKLTELDDRFHFLKKGQRTIDLGAAPGGWTQVAVQRVGRDHVIAIDLLEMEAVPGALLLQGDFLTDEGLSQVRKALVPWNGQADILLSDMAPRSSGHKGTDHLRIMGLIEEAADFASKVLRPGGTFVAKTLQGGTEYHVLTELKRHFARVIHAKPKASRKESAEQYLIAQGFRSDPKPSL